MSADAAASTGIPARREDGESLAEALAALDERKRELGALPLTSEILAPARRNLRILADHHSCAIEGNTLTLEETAEYLRSGTGPSGKPEREVLEVRGHDDAVGVLEEALRTDRPLTEEFLLRLHRVLMSPVVEQEAASSGLPPPSTRPVGRYKTVPNSVRTLRGQEVFTPPAATPRAMCDLLAWLDAQRDPGAHPVTVAGEFHWRFVEIHPFYDGNGRMARLLMNLILRRRGYPEAVFRVQERDLYFEHLGRTETEGLPGFLVFVAAYCRCAMDLYVRCGRGETVEEADDADLEITAFGRRFRPEDRAGSATGARSPCGSSR